MTYEEAKEILEEALRWDVESYYTEEVVEAFNKAIKAIEKQIRR